MEDHQINGIFLVGCPRSGTTLLQSMLGSHTQIISFPETHLFSETIPFNKWLRPFKIYTHKEYKKVERKLKELNLPSDHHELPEYPILSTAKWTHILINNIDRLAHYLSQSIPKYWLEKTPRHLHYASLINNVSPKCSFIHIIRRGEDVVASMCEATQNHPDKWRGVRSLDKSIFWWNRSIKHSEKFIGANNHHHLLYEDLVNYPSKVLENIFRYTGLQFEEQLLTSFHQTSKSVVNENEHWKEKNSSAELSFSNKFHQLSTQEQEYIRSKLYNFDYSRISLELD